MRRLALACVMMIAATGCATSVLQRYIGKDLAEIARRYGPPASHATLPSGLEAFEWVLSGSRSPAARMPLDTFMPVSTMPPRRREAAGSAGALLGGMCVYTVLARWEPATRIWRMVSYRAPRLDRA